LATTLINREEREVRQAISVAATCPGRHGAAIGKIACMRVERKEAVELMA
jgi:hypothetical protein